MFLTKNINFSSKVGFFGLVFLRLSFTDSLTVLGESAHWNRNGLNNYFCFSNLFIFFSNHILWVQLLISRRIVQYFTSLYWHLEVWHKYQIWNVWDNILLGYWLLEIATKHIFKKLFIQFFNTSSNKFLLSFDGFHQF